MNELAGKIDSGNYLAHHLDLDISVLNQIFEYIDKEQKYDDGKFLNILNHAKIVLERMGKLRKSLLDPVKRYSNST